MRAIRDAADPEAAARALRAALERASSGLACRRWRAASESGPSGSKRKERCGRARRRAGRARARRWPRAREATNEAAREALEPLAAGERPTVVTIGAVISALIALSTIVGYARRGRGDARSAATGSSRARSEAPLLSVIAVVALMGTMAWGMWKARYWAVLGFQALLVIVLVAASLGLVQATAWAPGDRDDAADRRRRGALLLHDQGDGADPDARSAGRPTELTDGGWSAAPVYRVGRMADSYDVIVIGGGPGGYHAAIRAAQLGKKTAVVETDKPGGRCLNYACIPAKTMLHTAEIFDHAQQLAPSSGSRSRAPRSTGRRSPSAATKVSETLSGGVKMLWDKNKVTMIEGEGALDPTPTWSSTGPPTRPARSSSRPARSRWRSPGSSSPTGSSTPGAPGRCPTLPKSIAVVGAGASGAEIASAYVRYGTEVTLIEMLDQILPAEDKDFVRVVERVFKKQGIKVLTGNPISDVEAGSKSVKAKVGDESIEVEYLAIAGGRAPDTEGLGLDAAGVKTGDGGRIEIDEYQRTSNAKVYAIGDLVRGPALAHKAQEEGVVAAETIAGAPTHPIDADLVAGRDLLPPAGRERRADRSRRPRRPARRSRSADEARRGRRLGRLRRPRRDRQARRRRRVRRDRRRPHRRQPRLRHDRRARRHDRARGRLPGARPDHPRRTRRSPRRSSTPPARSTAGRSTSRRR